MAAITPIRTFNDATHPGQGPASKPTSFNDATHPGQGPASKPTSFDETYLILGEAHLPSSRHPLRQLAKHDPDFSFLRNVMGESAETLRLEIRNAMTFFWTQYGLDFSGSSKSLSSNINTTDVFSDSSNPASKRSIGSTDVFSDSTFHDNKWRVGNAVMYGFQMSDNFPLRTYWVQTTGTWEIWWRSWSRFAAQLHDVFWLLPHHLSTKVTWRTTYD